MKGKEEKNLVQNLTRQPQLLRAPKARAPLDPSPGTMYPLNPPLVGSGGFRGGWGGCIPPISLKVTILAEKSASVSNNSAPFRDASPPTDLNVTNPAKNQSQFW